MLLYGERWGRPLLLVRFFVPKREERECCACLMQRRGIMKGIMKKTGKGRRTSSPRHSTTTTTRSRASNIQRCMCLPSLALTSRSPSQQEHFPHALPLVLRRRRRPHAAPPTVHKRTLCLVHALLLHAVAEFLLLFLFVAITSCLSLFVVSRSRLVLLGLFLLVFACVFVLFSLVLLVLAWYD